MPKGDHAQRTRKQPLEFILDGAMPKGDHAQRTRKHIDRLSKMQPTPQQIMAAHQAEFAANGVVTIPSGPFWSQNTNG